ncbi:MAG: hypothetical protein JWQ97_879 [Phenylobacterium sp.]|nr:hypothetical protein [Phenylobacterium sp.]
MTPPFNPLAGVALGAVLATVGGFIATQVQAALDSRRRRRNAALLCGEVLAAVERILTAAKPPPGASATLGPVTLRLLRAARREVDVYERNREHIFDLPDADLRARVHSFVVRLSIPLDRLLDDFDRYAALRATAGLENPETVKLHDDMQEVFKMVCGSVQPIPDLLHRLKPAAGYGFEAYSRLQS